MAAVPEGALMARAAAVWRQPAASGWHRRGTDRWPVPASRCWRVRATTAAMRCSPPPSWPPRCPGGCAGAVGEAASGRRGGGAARRRAGARRRHGAARRRCGGSRADRSPSGSSAGRHRGHRRLGAAASGCRAGWRAAAGRIIAVDLPSGIDPDTGVVADPNACVQAELTVTFGALKAGLVLPDGCWRAGAVTLVDIGLGPLPAAGRRSCRGHDDAGRCRFRRPAHPRGRQIHPRGGRSGRRSGGIPALAFCAQERPGSAASAWSATRGRARPRHHPLAGGRPGPRGAAEAGRAEAWIVGPGGGTDDAARPG